MKKFKFENVAESLCFTIENVGRGKPFVELKALCRIYGVESNDKAGIQIIKNRLAENGYKPIKIGRGSRDRIIQVRFANLKTTKSYFLFSQHVECHGWTRKQYKTFGWTPKLMNFLRTYEFATLAKIKPKYKLLRKGQEMLEMRKAIKISTNDIAINEKLRADPEIERLPFNWERVERAINKVAFVLNPFGSLDQRRLLLLGSFAVEYKGEYLGGKTESRELNALLKEHSWYRLRFPHNDNPISLPYRKINSRKFGTKYVYVFREHKRGEIVQNTMDSTDVMFLDEYLKWFFKTHDPKLQGIHQK